MEIGFERIHPTPIYPQGLNAAMLASLEWDSRANSVVLFKNSLKNELRNLQLGRCCYCRRMLSDDSATHLEHIAEKSAAPWIKFEIRNIGLCCGTCNNKKNSTFLRLSNRLSRLATAAAGRKVTVLRSPVLTAHLPQLSPLPTNTEDYRWVHPHFDNFGDHITIEKGWVFRFNGSKGARTVRGMELNALASIERRAMAERMASRTGLALFLGAIVDLNQAQATDICKLVAREIKRRLLG